MEEPPWEEDAKHPVCQECGDKFTVFNRRHHCRFCGRVLCDKCSKTRLYAPSDWKHSGKQRACETCVKAHPSSNVDISVLTYIVVLTDGEDNESSLSLAHAKRVLEAVNSVSNGDVKVILAGVGLNMNGFTALSDLASVGGGCELRSLKNASDIDGLFSHISLSLRARVKQTTLVMTDEDGNGLIAQRREIEPEARINLNILNVWFLLDASGSMDQDNKWRKAQAGIAACLSEMKDVDFAGLVVFNTRPAVVAAGQKTSINLNQFRNLRPSGGTALYDAVVLAIPQALQAHALLSKHFAT